MLAIVGSRIQGSERPLRMLIDDFDIIERYLRGELDVDAAARSLSFQGLGLSLTRPPRTSAEQVGVRKLDDLVQRVEAIEAAERLIGRPTATPMRLDTWDPPSDPDCFCCSVEVILRGRDAQKDYQVSMRLFVCTPTWVAAGASERGWTWRSSPLIVLRWEPAYIREALAVLMEAGADNTWMQFVERMHLYMESEE